jgi:hypothetical protein
LAGGLGLTVLGYWAYVDLLHPAPFYTVHYDPEMPYLLNSLAIFQSQPYLYVDHPGTPLELLGTLILGLLKIVRKIPSDQFTAWTLEQPEVFMRWGHAVISAGSALTAAALVFTTRSIGKGRDLLIAAGAAAVFFAVYPPYAFDSLGYWSHNSLNFPVGTLVLVILLARLRNPGTMAGAELILWGLIAGALTAVQLYFATWVVGIGSTLSIYVGLRTRKVSRGAMTGLIVGMSAGVGFLLATLPVLHRYRELAWWVRGLIVHQGIYGTGPVGVTSVNRLGENLFRLGSEGGGRVLLAGVAGVVLLAASMVLRRQRPEEALGWWAAVLGVTAQLGVTVFLIAKHPGAIYLLAIASVLPAVFVLAAQGVGTAGRGGEGLMAGLSFVVVIAFFLSLGASLRAHEERVRVAHLTQEEVARVVQTAAQARNVSAEEVVLLWGYGASSRCYALRFGNTYIGGLFSDEINARCTHEWNFNVFAEVAELPGGPVDLAESISWDVLAIPERHVQPWMDGLPLAFRSLETGLVYFVRQPAPSP